MVPQDNDQPNSGRIELFFNHGWKQICIDLLQPETLRVVCSQIGYNFMQTHPFWVPLPVNSRVWIYSVDCTGNEDTLLECAFDEEYRIGSFYGHCSASAGVTCLLCK